MILLLHSFLQDVGGRCVAAGPGGVRGVEAVAEGAAAQENAKSKYAAHVAPWSHHRFTAPERVVITLDERGHALYTELVARRASGTKGRANEDSCITFTYTDRERIRREIKSYSKGHEQWSIRRHVLLIVYQPGASKTMKMTCYEVTQGRVRSRRGRGA